MFSLFFLGLLSLIITIFCGESQDEGVSQDMSDVEDDALTDKLSRYYAEKVELVQRDVNKHWPLGIIHYYLDVNSYDYILGQRVRSAMDMIESVSCVQFHPHVVKPESSEGSWLHITNPKFERKCVHKPELKPGGEIMLVLGLDCLKRRDILHTLLHAIGAQDEVTHPQRDQYVRVIWENIQPEYRHLFQINTGEADSKTLVEYDPMSIMHFHDRAFSINGQATIAPLIPGMQISPSDKLSQLDKMKLRVFFGHECNRRKVDDLLDTCKNVLHEQAKDLPHDDVSYETNVNETVHDTKTAEISFQGPDRRAIDKPKDKITDKETKVNPNVKITTKSTKTNPKFNKYVKETIANPNNNDSKDIKGVNVNYNIYNLDNEKQKRITNKLKPNQKTLVQNNNKDKEKDDSRLEKIKNEESILKREGLKNLEWSEETLDLGKQVKTKTLKTAEKQGIDLLLD